MYMSGFCPETDLVFYKKGDTIMSGGYTIESMLMNGGIPPMTTDNNNIQKGGGVSSMFKNLAVPAGLLFLQQEVKEKKYESANQSHVDEDMHDKLLELVSPENRKKFSIKTRRNKNTSTKNKTRKK